MSIITFKWSLRQIMKTNDIKKGMVIQLNNGWYGIMADNMRGNTHMVDVDGWFREIGSVYSHDIKHYWPFHGSALGAEILVEGVPEKVEHTPAQLKLKESIRSNGF